MHLLYVEFVEGIALAGVYSLMAIGISFIYGVTGVIQMAQGGVMAVGAYAGLLAARVLPNLALALAAGIVASAIIGVLMYDGVFRRVRSSGHLSLVAALLIGTILEGVLADSFYGGHAQVFPRQVSNVLGGGLSYDWLVLGVALAIAASFEWFLSHSHYGVALRATTDNEEAARLLGVPTSMMMRVAFIIGSALAGGGGVLMATLLQYLSPDIANNVLFFGLAAVLLGGLGSIRGAVVGAFVIGLSQVMATTYISSSYGETMAFGIIVLVMVFRPGGMFAHTISKRA